MRANDDALVATTKALMDLVDQAGAKSGKYDVTILGSTGVQVGDNSVQINRF